MLYQAKTSPGMSVAGPAAVWPGIARGDAVFNAGDLGALASKAASYLEAGVPLNLSGPAGIGKTTLALHVAEARGRPVSFIAGHAWLTAHDFTGREVGQSTVEVVDRFVQSVRRTESQSRAEFRESALATAMERGHTLVYDEFTRATARANAVLLSVLEEGVLVLTDAASDRALVRAHPEFRIVLTSNPHDYVGVADAPDALMDRIVTLKLPPPGDGALAAIVAARSGLDPLTSAAIAAVTARVGLQEDAGGSGSMRAAILIARIAAHRLSEGALDRPGLAEIARDVLNGRGADLAIDEVSDLVAAAPLRMPS